MLRLHQFTFSHYCLKVRLALRFKNLVFSCVNTVPFLQGGIRGVSGQSQVPVLDDNGVIVADSTAILHYLEVHHPTPPLLPADAAAAARCWEWEEYGDAVVGVLARLEGLRDAGRYPAMARANAAPIGRWWFDPFVEVMAPYFPALLLRKYRAGPPLPDKLELARVFARVHAALRPTGFLVGREVTLADLSLAAMFSPLFLAPSYGHENTESDVLEWARALCHRYEPSLRVRL